MKCYICGTETIPADIVHKGRTIPALKCPQCNDYYTTIIHAKDLQRKPKEAVVCKTTNKECSECVPCCEHKKEVR
jgi:hypothetical protein